MTSFGWVLIQYDGYLYKKGKFGHEDRHAQGKDNVKTHRKKGPHDWSNASIYSTRNTKDCRQIPEA